jgi:hypothetical protein
VRVPRAGDPRRKTLHLSDHFRFSAHPEHGFVAIATANVPPHLAHWFLVREQFEPVPDTPGLYRLTHPEKDGLRRARQAVKDLRRHGYQVHTDSVLDPGPPQPTVQQGLATPRARIAQAAARPAYLPPALTTTPVPAPRPTTVPGIGIGPSSKPGRGR